MYCSGTWETQLFSLKIKRKGREYPQTSCKQQGRGKLKSWESEQLIVLNRLPVMGLAWGRGCLDSNKERINFMPYSVMDKTTKAKLSLITKKAAEDKARG